MAKELRDEWVRWFNKELERTGGQLWREHVARVKTQTGE